MNSIEVLLLIAIFVIYVAVMGGGTMIFCCTYFQGGLPFAYMNEVELQIDEMEKEQFSKVKQFCVHVDDVSTSLQKQAAEVPRYKYVCDQDTVIDIELGLLREITMQPENTGLASTDFIIPILE